MLRLLTNEHWKSLLPITAGIMCNKQESTPSFLPGGGAANVKLNQRIFEIPEVNHIFIYPNMGDGGCGTGAAFLANRENIQNREAYQNVYFGPAYNDEAIVQELQTAGLAFKQITPIEPMIAQLIHDGKVVARS
jgi:carbamoyltransferase